MKPGTWIYVKKICSGYTGNTVILLNWPLQDIDSTDQQKNLTENYKIK